MAIERRRIGLGLLFLLWLFCGGCGKEEGDTAPPETEVQSEEMPLESVAVPTDAPIPIATSEPTPTPAAEPAPASTVVPAPASTAVPTPVPTAIPTPASTVVPAPASTAVPTPVPTADPTPAPTAVPTPAPTTVPTPAPTAVPTPTLMAVLTPIPTLTPQVETSPIHAHEIVKEEKAVSCLERGEKRSFCVSCGEIFMQENIAPLGHSFEKAVWELPTCQKGGYYNNICTRCGLVECVSQNALAHEVEDIVIQEGNCMEDTVIQHKCKNCGVQVKEDTRYTNYEVHSWKQELVDGVEMTYCEWCGVTS